MQIRKKGDEIKKKSSPLKPLNQIKPSMAGWVPFKIVSPTAPPSIQDGYSAERKFLQKKKEYMLNYSLPCSCS
jgi:hypothetical protein